MGKPKRADQLEHKAIVLKELMIDCDITQQHLATLTGYKRPSINLVVNKHPYIPTTSKNFKKTIEDFLSKKPKAMAWLEQRGIKRSDIWKPLGKNMKAVQPVGVGKRANAARKGKKMIPALIPGDPEIITIDWEVEMISDETRRHFKLFKNPFIHDVLDDNDIFMTDEHRYIEAAMMDAAKNAGFLAVVGEVQSGKSTIRRKVVMQLKRDDNVRVIYPEIIDKTRVTATSLGRAIVEDISSEKAQINHEGQARQVKRLMETRHRNGGRHVLIIEEAHDLPLKILKLLKRFYELEDGYEKLLGIILIGQPELKDSLNEGMQPNMREVIRRIQIAEIRGLNGDIKEYLAFKFKRIKADATKIFTDDAIKALGKRLTTQATGTSKSISHAFPGLVNNYAAKAMNFAAEHGEPEVTEEIVITM